MRKSGKLSDAQLHELRAEAIKVMQARAERSPQTTNQQLLLARVMWFTLRRHGFKPGSSLTRIRRDGFQFFMDGFGEKDVVQVAYYRKDGNGVRCGEALQVIHDLLRDIMLPVLGSDNTELCMRVSRTDARGRTRQGLPITLDISCPPDHLLKALYRRSFPLTA
jgi:hypothetical protein